VTTARLRIALVVHDYDRTHGHSRYVVELAERFAAGHDVHVFANRFEHVIPGITTHRVPALRQSALLSIFSFVAPATMMIGSTFDIVHAQGLTVRGADVITAHICNARWLEGRKALQGGRLPWKEQVFGSIVIPAERWAFRAPGQTVIAISSALAADLQRLYGVNADRIVVIPHGVDPQQFHPGVRTQHRDHVRRELGLPHEAVVFVYVGDLRKGFEPAIRAIARVDGARLLGVSRTPADAFAATAEAEGVADRVTLVPATDQIERYYGAADALVLPTPYDAFGMVITEAMASGLPVITTPMAGASELVTPGVDGLLVDSATDIDALSAAMRTLASDAALRARMSDAAVALMSRHGWDGVAEQTLNAYRRHIAGRAATARAAG
jgi:UDP-glucose:(heptosyl)LPS alpha-1,3-glucosyltransferase